MNNRYFLRRLSYEWLCRWMFSSLYLPAYNSGSSMIIPAKCYSSHGYRVFSRKLLSIICHILFVANTIAPMLRASNEIAGQSDQESIQPQWELIETLSDVSRLNRYSMAIAHDSQRNVVVLFGGRTGAGMTLSDTWEFDDASWRRIETQHSPSERFWHALAFDEHRQRIVLFGGMTDERKYADTWEYDGRDWKAITTIHNPPEGSNPLMTYDFCRQKIVLVDNFGGTWEYDGTDWQQIMTAQSPPQRYLGALTYDSQQCKAILFGGAPSNSSNGLSDIWQYDGTVWTQQITSTSPPGRWGHAIAYDRYRNRTVLFGGYGPSYPNGSALADTWEYDGNSWIQMFSQNSPPALQQLAMTYDQTNKKIVLFTGHTTETWQFALPSRSDLKIEIHPNALYFNNGKTKDFLQIQITDNSGNVLNPEGHTIRFLNYRPDLVSVSDNGIVTCNKSFGSGIIRAKVDGIISSNYTAVHTGTFQLLPPILLLPSSSSATVTPSILFSDKSPVSLTNSIPTFQSSLLSVSTVDINGLVKAVRPPVTFSETPYIVASLGDIQANNATVVRITSQDLGFSLVPLRGEQVGFYLPNKPLSGTNYLSLFSDWEVVRVTDLAYRTMAEVVGLRPFKGDTLFLVNDPGHGNDGTVPCGISGNPIRLGTDVDTGNSCMVVAGRDASPQLWVILHEMSHDFMGENPRFGKFVGGGDSNGQFSYSEGLASNLGTQSYLTLQARKSEWNVPQKVLDNLSSIYHVSTTPDLDVYIANGKRYAQLNPSVVYDLMLVGYQVGGAKTFERFYNLFKPVYSKLPLAPTSTDEQATYFAAALSAAAGTDLKVRFKQEWGFPIIDSYYDAVFSVLKTALVASNYTLPGKANLVSPSGTIQASFPTFSWNAVPSSTLYYLWVDDSTRQGKIKKWYTLDQAGCASGIGICSVTPSESLAAGQAQWMIQTWNEGGCGPWSNILTFSVSERTFPGKAILISPSGSISVLTPRYTWNALPTATWYQLWINDSNSSPKLQQWFTAAQAGCGTGTGICSVTPSRTLVSGDYQWWVQTWNSAGYGPWSSPLSFTVIIPLPGKATLVSPSGAVSTRTPTFNWNAVSSATWYQLWVNDSRSAAKIKSWYTATQAGCGSGTGTCSVTPTTALASGSAQWWIQTWNDSGFGPWSDAMNFAVVTGGAPGKTTLVSPTGTIATTTPTYTWNSVSNSTWYCLWVSDNASNSAPKIQAWYTAAQAGCANGSGVCSINPSTTLNQGSAQWWIQTWNEYGYGPWSDPLGFVIP